MFLVFAVIVDDIKFIKALGMASWLDVELCGFFRTAIFGSNSVKIVHCPVESLLVNLTVNRERTSGVIVACYDRRLPAHDTVAIKVD